jgi:hypothetical protein
VLEVALTRIVVSGAIGFVWRGDEQQPRHTGIVQRAEQRGDLTARGDHVNQTAQRVHLGGTRFR